MERDVKIMSASELGEVEWTESRPIRNDYSSFSMEWAKNLSARVTTKIPTRYYRVLILSDNYLLSISASNPLRIWVVGWVGCVNETREPTGSARR